MAKNAREKTNQVRLADTKVSDFFPFACHYDGNTILTKNGELLQTIKIQGSQDGLSSSRDFIENLSEFREAARKAIRDNIKSDSFALYFHTVRLRQDISLESRYPDILSDYINQSWRKKNSLDKRFTSEFYITIIREGQLLSVRNPAELLRSLSFYAQRKYRNRYLKKAHLELNEVTGNIMLALKNYNSKRLDVYEKDGVCYSEPMEFFNKIMNLSSEPMVLDEYDISQKLTESKISFGFNAIEIVNKNSRHFSALFSVKGYNEMLPKSVETIFNLPAQIVITETADFVSGAEALKDYDYQKYILDLSKDSYFSDISGLSEITKNDFGNPTDYAQHQVTIMLAEESLSLLEREAAKFSHALSQLGLVTVWEDLMMEDCFWSQLPANFSFVHRNSYTSTAKLAAFTSISNTPIGQKTGNRWGNAISTFLTLDRTPYFFNFHNGDNGHSVIIGSEEKNRNMVLNFLLSESMKLNPYIFYFTKSRAGEIFLKGVGGKSYSFHDSSPLNTQLKLNPLSLPDSPANRLFLGEWLESMMTMAAYNLSGDERQKLQEIVAKIYGTPAEMKKLSSIAPLIEEAGLGRYLENFSFWHGGGKYAYIFDSGADNFTGESRINEIDLSHIGEDPATLNATVMCLLHRIKPSLNGGPAFIVFDDIMHSLAAPVFAPTPAGWLEEMKNLNCVVIFSGSEAGIGSDNKFAAIKPHLSTWIFLADEYNPEFIQAAGLNPNESELLKYLKKHPKNLVIKNPSSTTVVKFNITDLREIAAMLSADKEKIDLMEKTMGQAGQKPEKWLPPLVKKVV